MWLIDVSDVIDFRFSQLNGHACKIYGLLLPTTTKLSSFVFKVFFCDFDQKSIIFTSEWVLCQSLNNEIYRFIDWFESRVSGRFRLETCSVHQCWKSSENVWFLDPTRPDHRVQIPELNPTERTRIWNFLTRPAESYLFEIKFFLSISFQRIKIYVKFADCVQCCVTKFARSLECALHMAWAASKFNRYAKISSTTFNRSESTESIYRKERQIKENG